VSADVAPVVHPHRPNCRFLPGPGAVLSAALGVPVGLVRPPVRGEDGSRRVVPLLTLVGREQPVSFGQPVSPPGQPSEVPWRALRASFPERGVSARYRESFDWHASSSSPAAILVVVRLL
jgi:hypothetical protein